MSLYCVSHNQTKEQSLLLTQPKLHKYQVKVIVLVTDNCSSNNAMGSFTTVNHDHL